ncbi:selenocysteine lyase [Thecamonas trahens ATCC 50062]|uniref:Selenocysteine lyase n=1 Tax=Thecamonas trahens ATCC 50062 TaxID=461836 RepID=A0A0L0D441_THETB|nr:selenocysteine lyase [Thecamonas trahens ATCC 50062]KNC47025.1 selenocysteine lyase [Thecamonas trahens ATCC 50062]|eukprot:XP_013759805.1 selenocysteine lyase [Thecamonas trahens ATCC 50062]
MSHGSGRHRVYATGTQDRYTSDKTPASSPTGKKLLSYIAENVIGANARFATAFGTRSLVYADYTASGRSLAFIEDYIRSHVLPLYGNSHSSNSATSMQSTLFLHEAREMILKAVNGNRDTDVALFTGPGSTSAIHKMVSALGLVAPLESSTSIGNDDGDAQAVVFVSLLDHHSNILPWRESSASVVTIGVNEAGELDMAQLAEELRAHAAADRLLIGSFPAASNVTGRLVDTEAVTKLLHAHGALAFWDYATAAPYADIDMNPISAAADTFKDAIFISSHKFVGGPSAPGILVAKQALFDKLPRSCAPGGGTVFWVTADDHAYLDDIEYREEGGTPDIVGAIRAGLAFQLKSAVGGELIASRESELVAQAVAVLGAEPNVTLLGESPHHEEHHLALFSLLIAVPGLPTETPMFLHYNFVTVLLNDLFGIQVRGGCVCAGPLGAHLVGLTLDEIKAYVVAMEEDNEFEVLKPGFTRFNLPYFASPDEVGYILDALVFVARHGHAFLPLYKFIGHTAEWIHVGKARAFQRTWLQAISYSSGAMAYPDSPASQPPASTELAALRASYMAEAHSLREQLERKPPAVADQSALFTTHGTDAIRWFLLPYEAATLLRGEPLPALPPHRVRPRTYMGDSREAKKAPEDAIANSAAADIAAEMMLAMDGADWEADEVAQLPPCPARTPATALEAKLASATVRKPPRKLMNAVTKAIRMFGMIREGDRILVGVSGGKDSLTMLHTLLALQRRWPVKYEIGAVTVDPQTEAYDPSVLIPYMAALGVPYFYEKEDLIEQAKTNQDGGAVTSICSWCSRMKRGMIYTAMRREGYNVLAFGQHLDDFAESFIMSALFNGKLNTMKAHYTVDAGDLRVIRPMAFARESALRDFAYASGLPQVLAAQEAIHPHVFSNLKRALIPLMGADADTIAATS